MQNIITRRNIKIAGVGWALLGFTRGTKQYDYHYDKYLSKNNKTYFYTTKYTFGLLGIVLYCNPFTVPIMISRECYRAEITIRGLELQDKIEKDKYYELF